MISLTQATTKADADLIVEKVKTLNALRALLTDQQKTALNVMLERTTMMWKAAPVSNSGVFDHPNARTFFRPGRIVDAVHEMGDQRNPEAALFSDASFRRKAASWAA